MRVNASRQKFRQLVSRIFSATTLDSAEPSTVSRQTAAGAQCNAFGKTLDRAGELLFRKDCLQCGPLPERHREDQACWGASFNLALNSAWR